MSFLGIGSGTHPLSNFLSSTIGAITGGAANIASQTLNSTGGALFGGTISTALGGKPATPDMISAAINAGKPSGTGRAANTVKTGEGYDAPLKGFSLFQFHKTKPFVGVGAKDGDKVYDLDADGYPQWDWMHIVLLSGGSILAVWGIYKMLKPRRSSRRSSSRSKRRR